MSERKQSSSRWVLPAVLAAIYAHLALGLVPFVLRNNLLAGDGAGHLFLADFTGRYLLPWGSGWCDRVWGGFPAGQLYSPLFHILAGSAAALVGSPVFGVKIVVGLTAIAIPGVMFLVARRITPGSAVAQAVVTLALWNGMNVPAAFLNSTNMLGTNLESVLGGGMFPSQLGFLAFLLTLLFLPFSFPPSLLHNFQSSGDAAIRDSESALSPEQVTIGHRLSTITDYPRLTLACLPAVSMAAAVLSHPVWGLVSAVVFALGALVDLGSTLRSPYFKSRLIAWTSTGVLAVLLSGFFTVPLLVHSDLMQPIHLPSRWPAWLAPLLTVMAVLPPVVFRSSQPVATVMALTGLVVVAAVRIGDSLQLGVHLFRFTIPAVVMILPTFFGWLLFFCRSRWVSAGALALNVLFALLFHILASYSPGGNPDMVVTKPPEVNRLQGRILALSRDYHSPGYMALSSLAAMSGSAVSHGISVESAATGRAIMGLIKKLDPQAVTWGVEMSANPGLLLPDPDGAIAARQLDLLGFSHVLTDARWDLRSPLPMDLCDGKASSIVQPKQEDAVVEHCGARVVSLFPNFFRKDEETLKILGHSFFLSPDGSNFEFRLWKLPPVSLAIPSPDIVPVPAEVFQQARDHWLATGGQVPLPVLKPAPMLSSTPPFTVELVSTSATGDRLDLEITADRALLEPTRTHTGFPVYLKVPYHPHWRARDESGNILPLYPAGFGMLLLALTQRVSIQYETGLCEYVGRSATLAGLCLLAVIGLPACRRRKKCVRSK